MAVRGRCSASVVLFVLGVLAAANLATATLYQVGAAGNWTTPNNANNLDYGTWAASKTFHFGDELLFLYQNDTHDVYLVNSTFYADCNSADAIQGWDSGEDVIELTMGLPDYYFMCGKPGHCAAGQKFHISVSGITAPPTASTSSPPPPPPPSISPPSLLRMGVLIWSIAMVSTTLVLSVG